VRPAPVGGSVDLDLSSLLEKLMDKIKLNPETSALILIDLQHGIVALETSPHPAFSVVSKSSVACGDI
jgi:hypothetical protein